MAAGRGLPFPLVIVCLLFIRGYSPLPTTSRATGTNPVGPLLTKAHLLSTEDYDDLYGKTTVPNRVSPDGGIPKKCNYNPCLEGQISCRDLAAATSCSCPGSTLHDVVPDAPFLRSVSWNGSDVVLQWCAPNSYVTHYIVTVGGHEWQQFGKDRRNVALGDIDHIAQVCVVAANDRGNSEESCKMYYPRDNSLPLKAGLIGGALGFLLLLLLAVLLWRCKRQRKQEASISMHDTAEAQ
ncbi:LRRN4 C-terminal-like protein [Lates calcarifer]|uniref:LRRN4 C-terminal-like protein n=1 Tax=Lates calcarifer TaxID=8187 RepID=A0AAJ7Q6K6_LATCA|nr:LRRN4 C-terminal-like protein [Lates calcarifer]